MRIDQAVERVLKNYPATRDSDRLLILSVWWLQDNSFADRDNFIEFFKHKAYMPESITRARRKLQEDGKYLATKKVEEERYKKFKEARDSKGDSVVYEN